MTAIEIACRKCDSQKGEPCIVMLDGEVKTTQPIAGLFHFERMDDAAMMTQFGDAVDPKRLRAAIEATGRI